MAKLYQSLFVLVVSLIAIATVGCSSVSTDNADAQDTSDRYDETVSDGSSSANDATEDVAASEEEPITDETVGFGEACSSNDECEIGLSCYTWSEPAEICMYESCEDWSWLSGQWFCCSYGPSLDRICASCPNNSCLTTPEIAVIEHPDSQQPGGCVLEFAYSEWFGFSHYPAGLDAGIIFANPAGGMTVTMESYSDEAFDMVYHDSDEPDGWQFTTACRRPD